MFRIQNDKKAPSIPPPRNAQKRPISNEPLFIPTVRSESDFRYKPRVVVNTKPIVQPAPPAPLAKPVIKLPDREVILFDKLADQWKIVKETEIDSLTSLSSPS